MTTFIKSESGAVTVDWVVLTAGLVGLGLATMAVVSTGVQDAATDTEAQMSGIVITGFRSDREMSLREFFEARNASRANNGLEPVTWQQHNADHALQTDEDLLLKLDGHRAFEPHHGPWENAIAAYVASGHDPALAPAIYEAHGHSPEDAASYAASVLATTTPEEFATQQQVALAKFESRLEYYELEAEARGL